MISGENVLSAISALRNISVPYSLSNSARYGEASIAFVHSCKYSSSSGESRFQKPFSLS